MIIIVLIMIGVYVFMCEYIYIYTHILSNICGLLLGPLILCGIIVEAQPKPLQACCVSLRHERGAHMREVHAWALTYI